MKFDKALTEALQITVLKGIYNPSVLKPIQSTLERSSISVDPVDCVPAGVYSNLRREKVKLSDSLIREAAPPSAPPAPEGGDEGGGDEGVFDLKDPTAGGPEEQPEQEDPLQDPTEEPDLGDLGNEGDEGDEGLSSGSNYTVEMVKNQLDGILKMWMDLAGNYPEGDERHKFIEIGERLREISGVVERDFIQKHPG